jgi:hypothetical protein
MTTGFVHRGNGARGAGFGLVDHDKESGVDRFAVVDFQTFTVRTRFVSGEI